jgi:hypothetical protein
MWSSSPGLIADEDQEFSAAARMTRVAERPALLVADKGLDERVEE